MMRKVVLLSLLLLLSGCFSYPNSSVKITNLKGNSGGSGSIIQSGPEGSLVLTNAHVCRVVEQGGRLEADSVAGIVASYKVSLVHDLCLIKTLTNLGEASIVSTEDSQMFEPSVVIGHPSLLPTIASQGHFSGPMMVAILTGVRACTSEELNDPESMLVCVFLGGLPIVRSYEAQVVSSTIMPGSSGSPVYGADKRIKAVIFAGQSNSPFGYGIAVPHSYVLNFVTKESLLLSESVPNMSVILGEKSSHMSTKVISSKMNEVCKKLRKSKVCSAWSETTKYPDLIQE